jgi:predicted metal-dependent peptidase
MEKLAPDKKLSKALVGLILDQPFFGTLALRLDFKPTDKYPTAATNGKSLFYNPVFIDGLKLEEARGLLAHEVMHIAMNHHTRRNQRDLTTWNLAGDAVINGILKESRFVLPKGGAEIPNLAHLSTEAAYAALQEDQGPQGNEGEGSQSQPGRQDQNQPGKPGTDQQPDAEPQPGTDPWQCGAVIDYPDPEAAEAEEIDVKNTLAQAMATAKNRGKMPRKLEELINGIIEPKVSWQEQLRQFFDLTSKSNYDWNRPNRRFIAQGLYLPSQHDKQIDKLIISWDTSGSVTSAMIAEFNAELLEILSSVNVQELVLIQCDAQVNREGIKRFYNNDLPTEITIQGRGGTDYRPVFDYIEEATENPTALIYFTDGQCHFPKQEPCYPVLWVNPKNNWYEYPHFGETIVLE